MSYRCQLCYQPTAVGAPRLVHLVKRPDGSISRELAICRLCHEHLASGETVKTMLPPVKPKLEAPIEVIPARKFG